MKKIIVGITGGIGSGNDLRGEMSREETVPRKRREPQPIEIAALLFAWYRRPDSNRHARKASVFETDVSTIPPLRRTGVNYREMTGYGQAANAVMRRGENFDTLF